MQIEGEQRRIATIYLLAAKILLHVHVEDFITYLWTPRTHARELHFSSSVLEI